jgi:hypothetical protein
LEGEIHGHAQIVVGCLHHTSPPELRFAWKLCVEEQD